MKNLRVSDTLHKRLKDWSYKTGLPINTLTTIAIEDVLKKNLSELIVANNTIKAYISGVEQKAIDKPASIVEPLPEKKPETVVTKEEDNTDDILNDISNILD